jgi:hypothetical protein
VGSGLQGYTLISATNAVVNIPAFTIGTVNPVTATFTVPDISQPVDFTLRASQLGTNVLIHAQCSGSPTPTPTTSPTPTPTPRPTPGVCVPVLTVTDVFPGSQAEFEAITAGSGTVTVDVVNSGIGLQGLTVVSASNANVTIPPFPMGTFNPVMSTFTVPNPGQPVDFTIRASVRSRAVLIRAQCPAASQ